MVAIINLGPFTRGYPTIMASTFLVIREDLIIMASAFLVTREDPIIMASAYLVTKDFMGFIIYLFIDLGIIIIDLVAFIFIISYSIASIRD